MVAFLFRWLAVLLALASAPLAARATPSLDAATRAATEKAALEALARYYVLPGRLASLPQRLQAARAPLDAAPDGPAYAQVLGRLLAEGTQDRHVTVNFSPKPLPAVVGATAFDPAQERQQYRFINQGVAKVERLPGNLGYLDLRAFADPAEAKPKLQAAMTLLADTEALIIDLRKNGGGRPETVAYLSSFFFGRRTHLNDMVWRTRLGEDRESFYTERVDLHYDKPVWVLMSPLSFSAAEGFAYNLQQLKRAQVAGQPSGGGAHPGAMHRIGPHFSLFVPNGRSENPKTGGNWEGVGVQPDLLLPPADDALRVVQLRLLEPMRTTTTDPRLQRGLEARIQELQAAAPKP